MHYGKNNKVIVVFFLWFIILPNTSEANAQVQNKSIPLKVPASSNQINIDGIFNESEWTIALKLELKYETEPGENITPPVRTEVYLTHNNSTLYVAFKCFDDDPSSIRAHFTDREKCFGDDHVNIHIDTFNDERRHFTIGANAVGVQMDAYTTGGSFDWNWDAIYDAAGKIHDWGYVVELAIPFNQLRFQRTDGEQIWGFDAWRVYPRSKEHFMAVVSRDRNNNCSQCQMLKIEGFDGVEPGRNIELMPTLTTVSTDVRNEMPAGDFENTTRDAEAGITARWGITPNMTLSGTVNPDFSQVEADSRQLDINSRFALYFEEKRPFFLEGSDIFNSPRIEAVYTRTMRDPIWGGKLTGKEGPHTVGIFAIEDDITNVIFPGSQYSDATTLDVQSYAAVGRYKYDIGNKYTLGALITDREGTDYHNRVFGFDGDFRITNTDRIRAQFLGSNTKYPNEIASEFGQPRGDFTGSAYELMYSHFTRNFYFWVNTDNYGRDFRADLGFVPRVNYRLYNGQVGYRFRPKDPTWYSIIEFNTMYQYWEDQDGQMLNRRADLFGLYRGPMQSVAAFRYFKSKQFYNSEMFNVTYFGTYTGFQPNQYIFVSLDTSFGDSIDFANTRLGNRIRLNPEVTLRPTNHLTVEFDHHFEELEVAGEQLYTAHVSQGSVVYQFNTRTFVRAILQYVDYSYNVDLYFDNRDPELKQLFTQLLFSYKINPRTVLFLGYTDNYYGDQNFGLTQANRTLFAKIGYAWQM